MWSSWTDFSYFSFLVVGQFDQIYGERSIQPSLNRKENAKAEGVSVCLSGCIWSDFLHAGADFQKPFHFESKEEGKKSSD